MEPDEHESMETLAVLNYYSFPMEVEEDGYRHVIRNEMGFSA